MNHLYSSRTKLDFGLYRGYELGVVYIFAPRYLWWCMNNIEDFAITDLTYLSSFGVFDLDRDCQHGMIKEPSLTIPYLEVFIRFKDLINNVDSGENLFRVHDIFFDKNKDRLKNLYGFEEQITKKNKPQHGIIKGKLLIDQDLPKGRISPLIKNAIEIQGFKDKFHLVIFDYISLEGESQDIFISPLEYIAGSHKISNCNKPLWVNKNGKEAYSDEPSFFNANLIVEVIKGQLFYIANQ